MSADTPSAAPPDAGEDVRTPPTAGPKAADGGVRLGWLDAVVLLVSSGLAAGLVLFELGTRNLWVDEATTWGTASQHGASLMHWLVHDGGNMLGYYALMHLVVAFVGSSPTVLRLPTAICFVGVVPCTYLLMLRLFDRRAATIAALLVPCSVSLVFWGQEARGYVPGVFGITAGALALVIAVQDRRRWAWVAFVACSVFATYMVLLAALVVVAQVASLALLPRGRLELRRIGYSCLAILVLWSPLGAAALHRGSSQIDWISAPNLAGYGEIGRFLLSGTSSDLVTFTMLAACLVGLGLAIWALVRHGRSEEAFGTGMLVVWVVVPIGLMFVVSVFQQVMVDRYTLPMVPAASMLAAVACSRLRPAPLAWAAGVALIVVRAYIVPPGYGASIEGWSDVATFMSQNIHHDDCVAFFVADGFTAFDYYELRLPPGHDPIPQPVLPQASYAAKTPFVLDPATFSTAGLASVVAGCPRLWLIETHQAGERPAPGVPSYQVTKYEASRTLFSQLGTAYKPAHGYQFLSVFVVLYLRDPGISS